MPICEICETASCRTVHIELSKCQRRNTALWTHGTVRYGKYPHFTKSHSHSFLSAPPPRTPFQKKILFSLRLQSPNLLSFVCAPPAVASEVDYFFHPFKKNPHNWGTIYVIVKKNLHDEMEKEKTPLRHSHPRHGPRGHCGRGRDEAPKGILTTKKNT